MIYNLKVLICLHVKYWNAITVYKCITLELLYEFFKLII